MQEVARVYLSSNGKEFLIYDGNDNLLSVKSVTDIENVGKTVTNTVESFIEGE